MSGDYTVQPALDGPEWEAKAAWLGAATRLHATTNGISHILQLENDDYYAGFTEYIERTHAVAALALYGQKFGFTREDAVDVLMAANLAADVAKWIELGWLKPHEGLVANMREHEIRLSLISAKISALLPPEV